MHSDLGALLRSMSPVLNPGTYVYVLAPAAADMAALEPLATFREREGLTVIMEESRASEAGLEAILRVAWITLTVHSDLEAVGLTAAVAAALTRAGISCNVMAAAYHDHIFVPCEAGERALQTLQALQQAAVGNPA